MQPHANMDKRWRGLSILHKFSPTKKHIKEALSDEMKKPEVNTDAVEKLKTMLRWFTK